MNGNQSNRCDQEGIQVGGNNYFENFGYIGEEAGETVAENL